VSVDVDVSRDGARAVREGRPVRKEKCRVTALRCRRR
jgi:hypothetical protein